MPPDKNYSEAKVNFFQLVLDADLAVVGIFGSAFYSSRLAGKLEGSRFNQVCDKRSVERLKDCIEGLSDQGSKQPLPLSVRLKRSLGGLTLAGEVTRLDDGGFQYFGQIEESEPPENDNLWRRVLDRAVDGIIVERHNKALFVNKAMAELLGLSSARDLITGKSIANYIHPRDKERVKKITKARLAGKPAPEKYNMRIVQKDSGKTVWVTVHAGPIQWKGKKATISVLQDVTAEVEANRARERTEKLLKNIYDTIPDSVSLSRVSDNHFIEVNPGFERIFGYTKEEALGKSADDLGLWADKETRKKVKGKLRSNKLLSYAEGRIRTKSGTVKHIAFTASSMKEKGDDCLIVVARDITDKKRQERELRKSKEIAEQASRAKSDFLAKVSHELRTPLNAILGFSETMQSEMFGPLGDSRYKEYIVDIHESGRHLLDVINDILDLSKLEAGKLQVRLQDLDVRQVVDDCVRIMRERAEEGDLSLKTERPDEKVILELDEVRMRQILLNLLSNAIKFTRPGGTVSTGVRKKEKGWEVYVADTGPGMTGEELKRALTPFDQVLSSDIDYHEGTGLGLPLTKALVELMDGSFGIESVKGEGTIVTARFA